MVLPIRRWRAVVIGVVFALAGQVPASLSAGVVAPSHSDPMTSEASSPSAMAADHAPNVAIPVASNSVDREDAQPFWFPGADGLDSVSITSVPVRSSVDGTHASSPLPGTQQHPLIPLPGAAWTGMAGLLGLGAVKVLRNFRRLLA